MKMKLVHRDESAWDMGDIAYELEDTIEAGAIKARQIGICPGSDSYAAFMTAFSRRVRSRQLSAKKVSVVAYADSGAQVAFTTDYQAAS